MDYKAAVRENVARAEAEEKRLKQEMAKIAAEKAKKDREAKRNRDVSDGTPGRKTEIDDTKENVMEDLLKELSSSGPANNVRQFINIDIIYDIYNIYIY